MFLQNIIGCSLDNLDFELNHICEPYLQLDRVKALLMGIEPEGLNRLLIVCSCGFFDILEMKLHSDKSSLEVAQTVIAKMQSLKEHLRTMNKEIDVVFTSLPFVNMFDIMQHKSDHISLKKIISLNMGILNSVIIVNNKVPFVPTSIDSDLLKQLPDLQNLYSSKEEKMVLIKKAGKLVGWKSHDSILGDASTCSQKLNDFVQQYDVYKSNFMEVVYLTNYNYDELSFPNVNYQKLILLNGITVTSEEIQSRLEKSIKSECLTSSLVIVQLHLKDILELSKEKTCRAYEAHICLDPMQSNLKNFVDLTTQKIQSIESDLTAKYPGITVQFAYIPIVNLYLFQQALIVIHNTENSHKIEDVPYAKKVYDESMKKLEVALHNVNEWIKKHSARKFLRFWKMNEIISFHKYLQPLSLAIRHRKCDKVKEFQDDMNTQTNSSSVSETIEQDSSKHIEREDHTLSLSPPINQKPSFSERLNLQSSYDTKSSHIYNCQSVTRNKSVGSVTERIHIKREHITGNWSDNYEKSHNEISRDYYSGHQSLYSGAQKLCQGGRSPRKRSHSPARRSHSLVKRPYRRFSPASRLYNQGKRSPSPFRRHISSCKKSRSPDSRIYSPEKKFRQGSRSPSAKKKYDLTKRHRSSVQSSQSPVRSPCNTVRRSPYRRSFSPSKKSSSSERSFTPLASTKKQKSVAESSFNWSQSSRESSLTPTGYKKFQSKQSRSPSLSSTSQIISSSAVESGILERLSKAHKEECKLYRNNSESYPSYDSEKAAFMEETARTMAFEGVYPSAREIAKFWAVKIEELFEKNWETIKKECISMLSGEKAVQKRIDYPAGLHNSIKQSKMHSSGKYLLKPGLKKLISDTVSEEIASVVSADGEENKKIDICEILSNLIQLSGKLETLGVNLIMLYGKAVELKGKGENPANAITLNSIGYFTAVKEKLWDCMKEDISDDEAADLLSGLQKVKELMLYIALSDHEDRDGTQNKIGNGSGLKSATDTDAPCTAVSDNRDTNNEGYLEYLPKESAALHVTNRNPESIQNPYVAGQNSQYSDMYKPNLASNSGNYNIQSSSDRLSIPNIHSALPNSSVIDYKHNHNFIYHESSSQTVYGGKYTANEVELLFQRFHSLEPSQKLELYRILRELDSSNPLFASVLRSYMNACR